MALSADDGPETVAADIRKRFAAIRRAKSFLNRPSQQKLAQELSEIIHGGSGTLGKGSRTASRVHHGLAGRTDLADRISLVLRPGSPHPDHPECG